MTTKPEALSDDELTRMVRQYSELCSWDDTKRLVTEVRRLRAENAQLIRERDEHRATNCDPFDATHLRAENARQAETIARLREVVEHAEACYDSMADDQQTPQRQRAYWVNLRDGAREALKETP